MEKIKTILKRLCSLCTVSGREKMCKNELFDIAGAYFDTSYEDSFGNLVLVKKSSKENAPRLLIDAHFDEVGFMVSKVHENGFLSIAPIGGVDTRVLGATSVVVYSSEQAQGLLTSTPPHLLKGESLPKMENIYVDMLGSKASVEVGDIVGYAPHFTELCENKISAKSLDDKACVCAIIDMASKVDKDKLEYDLYVVISAQEETGKSGARFISYDIEPDIAIVTDVFFASGEGIDKCDSIDMGCGAYVDFSAVTDRALSSKIAQMTDENGKKCQIVCEPSRTHTNAEAISISGRGVRVALLGVAIDGMHTPSEIVALDDIKSLSDILLKIAYTEKL